MKTALIIAAAAAGFAGISAYNYRRFVPKPRPLCEIGNEVETTVLTVPFAGHTLYGELMLPKGTVGKLPTIICSHGFNGSYRYFRNSVGMSLAMSGFAVYCYDFYGGSNHSKSGGKMTEMSILSERDQLCAVIETIKRQPTTDPMRLFLLGESQGGFVTALAAARHNRDVNAVVLFYPAFCARDDMLKNYTSPNDVPETIRIMGKKVGRTYYKELFDIDAYAEAGKFQGAALVIHGDSDRTVNISYGQQAAESYPNGRFAVLPGEDHGFSAKGKLRAARMTYEFFRDQCGEETQNA